MRQNFYNSQTCSSRLNTMVLIMSSGFKLPTIVNITEHVRLDHVITVTKTQTEPWHKRRYGFISVLVLIEIVPVKWWFIMTHLRLWHEFIPFTTWFCLCHSYVYVMARNDTINNRQKILQWTKYSTRLNRMV